MTSHGGDSVRSGNLLRRLTLAACPTTERRWLEAIFAESEFAGGRWQRFRWSAGACTALATVIWVRAEALVPNALRWSLGVVALVAIASFVAVLGGYEGLGVDDDVFFALACGSIILAVVLGGFALARIFGHTRPISGVQP